LQKNTHDPSRNLHRTPLELFLFVIWNDWIWNTMISIPDEIVVAWKTKPISSINNKLPTEGILGLIGIKLISALLFLERELCS
jgi:hypothetical protein